MDEAISKRERYARMPDLSDVNQNLSLGILMNAFVMPLLSDAVLERERVERPPGYDRNPDAIGEPQVVSMNGVLASEACNSALDLITGYADGVRGAGWWGYDGRRGEIMRYDLPSRRRTCPACAEQGHGDPTTKPFPA